MKSPEMYLECVCCGKTYDPWDLRYKCDCGGILDVKRDLSKIDGAELRKLWDSRWGLKRGKDAAGVDATAINVEINQRIALALAPIAFMMLGMPLAIRTSRRETSIGLILSVALGALYYGGVLVSDALRYNPQFYPQYVVWIPPLLFQLFGVIYLTKIARK